MICMHVNQYLPVGNSRIATIIIVKTSEICASSYGNLIRVCTYNLT